MQLLEPLDEEVDELYELYHYCKLFHCSPAEYEQRPHKETRWLLGIDHAYNQAVKDVQDRQRQQG